MRRAPLLLRLLICTLVLAGASAPAVADGPRLTRRADGLIDVAPPGPGMLVRYTLDGSDPARDSGVWLAPVDVPPGYVLKARAFAGDGAAAGDIATHETPLASGSGKRPSTLVPVTQNRDWRTYDWAQRHEAAVTLMRARPEVVMLGDSITHFWGGDPVGGRRNGPAEWDRFFAGRRVVNLGYGWDRTENVLWRLTQGGEFDGVSPRVVVVMIGTNNVGINTPDEIAAGIEAICASIHARSPTTRILLLGIFPRGERPNPARDTVVEVNRRIAALDGRDGITYLDIGSRFLAPDGSIRKDVMSDFLHPTARGYAIWAEAMAPTLERLLAPQLSPAPD